MRTYIDHTDDTIRDCATGGRLADLPDGPSYLQSEWWARWCADRGFERSSGPDDHDPDGDSLAYMRRDA